MTRPSRTRRIALGCLAAAIAIVLTLPASAGAKIYRGTADEEVFQPPRPTTDFVFQVKGKRARVKNLVLALECTPDDDKDPRTLVPIKTPFRRTHTVLQNRSYDFHGTVQSSLGAIKFDTTISVRKNRKVIGAMVAKIGNCVDQYVDLKAH